MQRNDFVNLEFEALKENTLLQILDLNGRKVRTFDLKAGQECLRIDVGKVKIVEVKAGEKQKRIELGDFAKGTYFIRLGNTTKKLIIE